MRRQHRLIRVLRHNVIKVIGVHVDGFKNGWRISFIKQQKQSVFNVLKQVGVVDAIQCIIKN